MKSSLMMLSACALAACGVPDEQREQPPQEQTASAAQPLTLAYQGEWMADFYATSVWNGGYRAFWATDSRAQFQYPLSGGGAHRINLVGFATHCRSAPVMNVNVWRYNPASFDWSYITTLSAAIGTGYAAYGLGAPGLPAGTYTFELVMKNDNYVAGVCDSNIFVDYVTIDGV